MPTPMGFVGGKNRVMALQPGEALSNSSAVLAVTAEANLEEISAVLRTAILLGKTLNASVSVDLFGEGTIVIEAADNQSKKSLAGILNSILGKLRKWAPARAKVFALEASLTAGSFLSVGIISLRIRGANSVSKRPMVAR
jgi:hypothetical protein